MRVALAKNLAGSTALSWRTAGPSTGGGTGADQGLWRGRRPVGRRVPERRFPGLALPFVPGQEVAGVVEAAGDGAGVQPGDRVYASLFPAGGGFAELALASADRLAPMPTRPASQEAAGLVIGAGTAHEALVDWGLLRAGETVLITAAVGGVGSAAVQIAVAMSARPVGVASLANHEYLRGLGASEVFDYHAADWVEQVLAVVPGGVDLLFDCVGGQTMDQAVGSVRDDGRVISVIPPFGSSSSSGASRANRLAPKGRQRLGHSRVVDSGHLRPQVEAVLPLGQVRGALRRVASRHTRGKIVLQIGQ